VAPLAWGVTLVTHRLLTALATFSSGIAMSTSMLSPWTGRAGAGKTGRTAAAEIEIEAAKQVLEVDTAEQVSAL